MSFKYVNPGYKALLVPNVSYPNAACDVVPTSAQSRTGIAFINYLNYGAYSAIENMPNTSGSEIWASCDFFWDNSKASKIYFGNLQSKSSTTSCIVLDIPSRTNSKSVYLKRNGNELKIIETQNVNDLGIRPNSLNHIWLHIFFGDASAGYVEFQINNKYFGKYTGYSTSPNSTSKHFMIADGESNAAALFSSVIISDEYISPYERVIPLAVSNTVTDMASDTGLFVATNASETLLQSVTTTSLAEEYGSDAQVTGIALVGNPAYEVDDVIGSLTAISKHNGTVTEHNKITLLTDSDAMIVSSFSLPTDTTVADLSNYQFGWRSEE